MSHLSSPEHVRHYDRGDVLARVLGAVREAGLDPVLLDPDALAACDEFHLGGALATREVSRALRTMPEDRVLDLGCGIGGPARTLARQAGCRVTGLDLTPGFVAVATELSRRCGLSARTRFQVGDALQPPFPDEHFDGVTLLHVGMNIAAKDRLFAGATRVLRRGARFVVYDIVRKEDEPLDYPVPWSSGPDSDHLARVEAYREAAEAAGLHQEVEEDLTELVQEAIASQGARRPAVHLGHLMGADWPTLFANLRQALDAGTVAPTLMVFQRR